MNFYEFLEVYTIFWNFLNKNNPENDSLRLHQCQRPQRRYNVYREGQTPATEKELNQNMTICNNMMHAMTWQYDCVLA